MERKLKEILVKVAFAAVTSAAAAALTEITKLSLEEVLEEEK